MEYKLLWSDSVNDLNKEVNGYLKDGWKPYGFPFSAVYGTVGFLRLYQAVIKEPTPKLPKSGFQDL